MVLWPNGSDEAPRITGEFGPRTPFWTPGGWTSDFHYGLDMVGFEVVRSPVDGDVIMAASNGGFGLHAKVRADDRDEFWHAHLARFLTAHGARVRAGDPLGIMGTTGKSTGVHLHWEIHPGGGAAVDPRAYMRTANAGPAGDASTDTEYIQAALRRSGDMEAIIRLGNEVRHVFPGGRHRFGTAEQYNRVRGTVAKLRQAGHTNLMALPPLAQVTNVSAQEWSDLADYLGAPR